MTTKYEVVIYSESNRQLFDTEFEAEQEADYQSRLYGRFTRIQEVDIEDNEE